MRPAADHGASTHAPAASFARRALSLIYEALLLTAVVFIGSLPFVMLTQGVDRTIARPLFQIYLVALTGAYFTGQWRAGSRTLPMKTWHMRLLTRAGAPLTWRHAITRFAVALPGTLLFGTGFLWALVDREKLFLHDRLAGTKIVMSNE